MSAMSLMAQRVDAPRAGYPVQPHDGVLVASPAVRTQVGLGPLVVPSLQPVHEARRRRVRREALAHVCVQLHPEPRVRHRLGLALGRLLRPVALSGSMSIAACQIPSALLYVEPPPPIAIVGLPSCEMHSHNGPPRGIHSYLCEMKTVGIKPFLRFPNS